MGSNDKGFINRDINLFGKEAISPVLINKKFKIGEDRYESTGETTTDQSIAEKEVDLKKLLHPADELIFNLVDLFSELNEKRTEFMRVNINDFFGDSFIAEVRRVHSPPISPINTRGEMISKNFSENPESLFIPKLRGVQIINFIPPMYYFARTNTCPLLKKISMTIDLILAYCPISSLMFFSLLTDQFSVLERFLSTTSSRVIICEAIEKILQSLISVKSIFIRLHDAEMRDMANKSLSHRASPRNQFRDQRDSKSRPGNQLRREDSLTLTQGVIQPR